MAQPKLPKKRFKRGDLPNDKAGWISYINDIHDTAILTRKPYEFQWLVNEAFFRGFQRLIWHRTTHAIQIDRAQSQDSLVINRIAPFIERRHAKILRQSPTGRVLPNTNNPDDSRAARFSDMILKHLQRKIEMPDIYDLNTLNMLKFGTSFINTMWDPNGGDFFLEPKKSTEGDLSVNQDGSLAEERIFEGEVDSRTYSPFNVLVSNDCIPTIKDQDWVILRTHHSISECERVYPHLAGTLKDMTNIETRTEFERQMKSIISPRFTHSLQQDNRTGDQINSEVLLKTFMMRPNREYENGLIIVLAGDEWANSMEFPDNYGKNVYPLVRFAEHASNHFYAPSTLERLIDIQKAFNTLRQRKFKHIRRMANSKWMVPLGSKISDESLDDTAGGEIVEYNPSVPAPSQSGVAPLPNYFSELENNLIVDFRDVGNQTEQSQLPGNLTAAVALQTAAELQDEGIQPIIRRYARSMELVANQQLLLVQENYIEPRQIKIIGDDGRFAVQWISGADLAHNVDVHIEIESMLPEFRGQKQQRLFDFWDRQIITNPGQFMRMFRAGSFDELIEEQERSHDMVMLEIEQIKAGRQPEISPVQNHILHATELTKFIQTPNFLALEPDRKQLAIQTLQAHVAAVQGQLPQGGAAQTQTNQAAVGTPFGPSVPRPVRTAQG